MENAVGVLLFPPSKNRFLKFFLSFYWYLQNISIKADQLNILFYFSQYLTEKWTNTNKPMLVTWFLFDWLGPCPLESSGFGGVFIFSVTFYTVKSHSICAFQCGESHLMFLHSQISNQEHPLHLLASLPFLLHEAHDQSHGSLCLSYCLGDQKT